MYLLSIKQIQRIEQDVLQENITFSHLHHDLVDHVCCDVEERVKKGIEFELAYTQVRQEIGLKGLKQIQQETLLLIDKKYRMMKKSMKTMGTLALALLALAVVFKFQHWPGAGSMMSLGFIIICFMFYPSLLYTMYKEVSSKKQAGLYVFAFLGGLLFMTGIYLKVQHWPHATLMFSAGSFSLLLLLIPVFFLILKKSIKIKPFHAIGILGGFFLLAGLILKFNHLKGAYVISFLSIILLSVVYMPTYYFKDVKNSIKPRIDFIFGIIALVYIVLFTTLVNTNLSRDRLQSLVKLDQEIIKNNELLKDAIAHSSNEKINTLKLQAEEIHTAIEELKKEMVCFLTETDKNSTEKYIRNLSLIKKQGNPVNQMLLDSTVKNNTLKIYTDMLHFQERCFEYLNTAENKKLLTDFFIDKSDFKEWEMETLGNLPGSYALHNLTVYQYKLRLMQIMLQQTENLEEQSI